MVPSWHIYMKIFMQIGVHHFCGLHITIRLLNCAPCADYCIIFYLTSELCAKSCTNALTFPYPELGKTSQYLNSKSGFWLLGTFFGAGSHILDKFWERVENYHELSRKKI